MRSFAYFLLSLNLFLAGLWVGGGFQKFRVDQVEVIEVSCDFEFAETHKNSKWVKDFKLGLLDGLLPGASILTTIALGLLYFSRKEETF
jgi:sulfite exporter TauE/SafE